MRWLKTTCMHKLSGIPSSALVLLGLLVQESRGTCCPRLSLAHQKGSARHCVPCTAWDSVWNATEISGSNQCERHIQWRWMRSSWRSSLPNDVIYKLTKFLSSHLITFCSSNKIIIVNLIATMSVGCWYLWGPWFGQLHLNQVVLLKRWQFDQKPGSWYMASESTVVGWVWTEGQGKPAARWERSWCPDK